MALLGLASVPLAQALDLSFTAGLARATTASLFSALCDYQASGFSPRQARRGGSAPVMQHSRQGATVECEPRQVVSPTGNMGHPTVSRSCSSRAPRVRAVEWSMWPSGSAERSGIRVIAVDRPGLGWSDWQPRRRVVDGPVDVTALADALGLQRFAVLGLLRRRAVRAPPASSYFRTASVR